MKTSERDDLNVFGKKPIKIWQMPGKATKMRYLRGFIGVVVAFVGIVMLLFESTKLASWLFMGFGLGMISAGFDEGGVY